MATQSASSIPWNANAETFPIRKELVSIPNAPEEAAWVWGEDDGLGRLNLLTPARVAAAAKETIQSGEIVPVNLPLDVPRTPAFGRKAFSHEIVELAPERAYDDIYHMNTQSGTQWDGFRHFAHMASATFYNGTKSSDIVGEHANHKCSIHHWAEHGIAGRGVLIDYWGYAQKKGIQYDPYARHAITWDELYACGKDQGIDIRPAAQGGDIKIGDLLFVRSGFVQAYYSKTEEERHNMAIRKHEMGPDDDNTFAGVAQGQKMLDWLHDSYFSAVAGDAPSFEVWPTFEPYYLHEYILALWGMPLGEMLDLEKLAQTCKEKGRYFFFFTAAPANVKGGIASHVNGTALF